MSQKPINISMRSKKQHIRLWFECLQICHSNPEYSENLEKSKNFYKEWGDVKDIKFDAWWKDHKYLFDEVMVKEVSKVSSSPNTLTLSIPLNESVSTIIKDVKRIVEQKQSERLAELGENETNRKSKRVGVGKYSFTQKEIKGLFHYQNLEMYKIFLKLNKPSINRNFLIEVRKNFDSRVRSQLRRTMVNLPQINDFDRFKTNADFEDVIRSVRRSLKSVEKTLLNVSEGRFP
ncbi:hypothetical protein A9199_12080 [Donghicola sp. JL3646]|nr:hypothetical protein BSK21_13485 [Marivivens sp. JLT3646]OBR35138.1 hypothetical protein A9199_12080 [Donghicola sp. JL3646]